MIGYERKPLKAVASIFDDVLSELTPNDFEFRYIDIGNVDSNGDIVGIDRMVFRDAPSRARRRVQKGDVIVSTVRTYLKAIAAIEEDADNLIVSTGFAVLRPRSIEPRFLAYAVRSEPFLGSIVANSQGVSYPAILPSRLASLTLPVPPPDDQRAIVRFLDEETATIDALIEKKQQLVKLVGEARKSFLGQVFHRLREEIRREPLRRHIAGIQQGVSPVCHSHPRADDAWGVLKLSAVDRGSFRPNENKSLPAEIEPDRRYEVRHGDLLITRANTPALVGDACVVKDPPEQLLMSDLIYRVSLRPGLSPDWVALYLLSPRGRALLASTARGSSRSMVKIRTSDIKNILVPAPAPEVQAEGLRRVAEFDARLVGLDASVSDQLKKLQEYRSALITAAVTGQMDVGGAA